MRKRSVCITTYGLIVTQWQALGETRHGTEFVWDYIILDEGHRIKNPSKTTKRLHSIPAKNRIILTGILKSTWVFTYSVINTGASLFNRYNKKPDYHVYLILWCHL